MKPFGKSKPWKTSNLIQRKIGAKCRLPWEEYTLLFVAEVEKMEKSRDIDGLRQDMGLPQYRPRVSQMVPTGAPEPQKRCDLLAWTGY